MELKIYNPQDNGFLQKIEWNFEDLKHEIADTVQSYKVSVYTDDTIKQAKADRAKLNKFVDAIDNKRKEVKKKLLSPYEQFEKEEKELISIVQSAITNIDGQIKGYEERMRADKTSKVREFYESSINDLADVLPFDKVFKAEYANSSTTMKSIKDEIMSLIQKVDEGLAIIHEVDSKFAYEMKEIFLKTYDIGQAMTERNRLEAAERKRQEYEAEQQRVREERQARQKQEVERVIHAGRCIAAPASNCNVAGSQADTRPVTHPEPAQTPARMDTVEDPVNIIDFRVYATMSQLAQLKNFLKCSGIRYEPVPKQ